jgi:hypothetical protein
MAGEVAFGERTRFSVISALNGLRFFACISNVELGFEMPIRQLA